MNDKKNVIIKVEEGSIAYELNIAVGDILVSINGQQVNDIFDYRYLCQDEYIELLLLSVDGESYILEIEKDEYEELGIVFESGLMDNAKSCSNKCIFCFIDQLPKGMRDTLYFKDDDSRLSFLQGNYVTLTNMSKEDIDHIIFYHLSPINISVHTTDLELRKKMLKNKNADKVLDIMKRLAEANITMNLQVVLCKNINDGKYLDKTIADCKAFYPYAKSMSVVPVGISKYRDNLYPLLPFSKEDCEYIIQQTEKWQKECRAELGTAFVFLSDEFYLKSEKPFPSKESYEDFTQYENGVGMSSLLKAEFLESLENMIQKEYENDDFFEVSIATGEAAFDLICELARKTMEKFPEKIIRVYKIKNEFFGGEITVSGLLTGQDICSQLKKKELGHVLLLPDSLLRNDTDILLDDMSIAQIEAILQIPIKITRNFGDELLSNMLNEK